MFKSLYVSKYILAFLKKSRPKKNFLHFTLMQQIIASWLVTCFSVCNVNELEKKLLGKKRLRNKDIHVGMYRLILIRCT